MVAMKKTRTPADVYDELFVPALFRQWGPVVAEAAKVQPGQTVIDVACGTGALTLAVADRVGPRGRVTGLDTNPDMLRVARRKTKDIEWREGVAEKLPFANESFDAAVSQFGLMFFTDGAAALREMMRVLRPGGHLAIAVCDALARSPGYDALANLLQRLFGNAVADAFRAPFALGDQAKLLAICHKAGIGDAVVERHNGMVRFASISSLISTERACIWTLGGLLDEQQFALLLEEAGKTFQPFVTADGHVAFDMPALIITAVKEHAS